MVTPRPELGSKCIFDTILLGIETAIIIREGPSFTFSLKGSGIPDSTLKELERILQGVGKADRVIAEAYMKSAIYHAMQARSRSPGSGHLNRLSNGLREAVDRFNR